MLAVVTERLTVSPDGLGGNVRGGASTENGGDDFSLTPSRSTP
jgi:hypothetical protein